MPFNRFSRWFKKLSSGLTANFGSLSNTNARRNAQRAGRHQLQLEVLEERAVPAVTYSWAQPGTSSATTTWAWNSSANWTNNGGVTGAQAYPHLATDIANFTSSFGEVINLNAAESVASVTFSLGGTTVLPGTSAGALIVGSGLNSGGPTTISAPVVLTGNVTANMGSFGGTLGISGPISQSGGSYGITLTGANSSTSLTLTGANSLTGPLVVNPTSSSTATLTASPAGLGSESVTLDAGGNFSATSDGGTYANNFTFAGAAQSMYGTGVKYTGTITINSGATLTINGGTPVNSSSTYTLGNPTVITGTITGAGNLTLAPSGTNIILAGTDLYTGTTTINSTASTATGAELENGAGLGVQVNGTGAYPPVIDNGQLIINSPTAITINNPISTVSGDGYVYQEGGGALTLTGNNTFALMTFPSTLYRFSGFTILAGGSGNAFGSATVVTPLSVIAGNTIGGVGTILQTVTLAGTISPSTTGSGTPAVGTLTVGSLTSAAGSVYNVYLNGASGSTIASPGSITLGAGLTTLNLALGSTALSASSYTILSGTYTGTFAGLPTTGSVLTAGGQIFTITYNATTVVLNRVTSTFSNFLYVDPNAASDGTLTNPFNSSTVSGTVYTSLASANTAAGSSDPVIIAYTSAAADTTAAVLSQQENVVFTAGPSGSTYTIASLSDGSSYANDVLSLSSGVTLALDNTASLSLYAPIGGSGSLTYTGSAGAALTLAGANTFSGATTINSGVVNNAISSTTNNGLSPNSVVTVAAGATLNLVYQYDTVAGLSGAGTVAAGTAIPTDLIINIANSSTNDTFSGLVYNGTLGGNLKVIKEGPGTETLTGGFIFGGVENTATENSNILAGNLALVFGGTASVPVTGASWTGGVATITVQNALTVGQTVTITGIPGYNGAYVVTSAGYNSFSYSLTTSPATYTSGGTISYTTLSSNIDELYVAAGATLTMSGGTNGVGFSIPNNPNGWYIAGIGNVVIISGNSAAAGTANAAVVNFNIANSAYVFFFNGNLTFETTGNLSTNTYTIAGLQPAMIGASTVTVDAGAQFAAAANGSAYYSSFDTFNGNFDGSYILNGSGPVNSSGYSTGALEGGVGTTGDNINSGVLTIGLNGATITDFGGSETSPLTINATIVDATSGNGGVTFGSGASSATSTSTTETINIDASDNTVSTTVAAGTLVNVNTGGSLGTGAIIDNGIGAYAGIDLNSSQPMNVAGSVSGAGNFVLAGTGGVNFDNTTAITVSPALTGVGPVTVGGSSSVDLTATGSSFSGGATVNTGTLLVDGTLTGSSVTVASGAILGGHGTISGTATVNGTLNPATVGSVGILTIGTLTFGSGSAFGVDLLSASSADEAIVTGTATLTGATLTVNTPAGFSSTAPITIVSAGAISGTFTNGSTVTSSGGQTFTIAYTSTGVTLTLAPVTYTWAQPGTPSVTTTWAWNSSSNWTNNGGITGSLAYPHLATDIANITSSYGEVIVLNGVQEVASVTFSLGGTTVVPGTTGAALEVNGALNSGGPTTITAPVVLLSNTTMSFGAYGGTLAISGPITQSGGSFGITESATGGGSGLTLTGANSLTGSIVFNSGTLTASPAGIGEMNVTLNGTANFDAVGDSGTYPTNFIFAGTSNQLYGSETKWAGILTINSGDTLTINGGSTSGSGGTYELNNPTVITGTITGAGNLTLTPSGTNIILESSDLYTGSTTISTTSGFATGVYVENGSGFGVQTNGTGAYPAVTANGYVQFFNSTPITINNPISGTGYLVQAGSGSLTLAGNNAFTGVVEFPVVLYRVGGYTLLAANSSNAFGTLTSSTTVTVAAGDTVGGVGSIGQTLSVAGTINPSASSSGTPNSGTLNVGGLTASAGSVYDVYLNGASSTYLTSTAGTINIGPGSMTLNIVLGSTTLSASSYTIVSASTFTASTYFAGLPSGAVVTAGGQIFTISYSGTGATLTRVTSSFTSFLYVDANLSNDGTLTNPFNASTVSSNTFTSLSAANAFTSISDPVIIVYGSSAADSTAAVLNRQEDVVFVSGPSGSNYTIASLSDGSSFASDLLQISSGVTLTMDNSSSLNLFAPISGAGSVTYTGASTATLTLAGADTYSGTTTINSGVLTSTTSYSAFSPNSVVAVASAGTFTAAYEPTVIAGLTGSGTVGAGGTNPTDLVINVANASTTDTFSGLIWNGTGAGALKVSKMGAGTEAFTGSFIYGGGLTNIATGINFVLGGNLEFVFGATNTMAVSAASWSSGTATITAPNALVVGQSVTISGISPSGYNGTYVVTSSAYNQFSYALASNPGTYSSGGTISYILESTNVNMMDVVDGATLTLSGGTNGVSITVPSSTQGNFFQGTGTVDIITGNSAAAGSANAAVVNFNDASYGSSYLYYFNGSLIFQTTGNLATNTYSVVDMMPSVIGTSTITVNSGAQFGAVATGTTFDGGVYTFDGNYDGSYILNGSGTVNSSGYSTGAFEAGVGSTGNSINSSVLTIGSSGATITDFGGSESSPLTINATIIDATSGSGGVIFGSGESAGTSTSTTETINIDAPDNTVSTTVAAGTLVNVNTGGSLGTGAIVDNGTGSYAGIDLNSILPIYVAGSISGSGNFVLAGTGGVDFDNTTAITVSPALTGVGPVVINGSSSVDFTGTGSSYTGATTVSSGTLFVDGTVTASTVTIASGATLGGHGTISGTATVNGTLNPATAGTAGTLTIGTLTFGSGSAFGVDLLSGSSTDEVVVTGTATLGGATFTINTATGFDSAAPITIVSAASISGTFSYANGATIYSSTGQAFQIAYSSTSVTLTPLSPVITPSSQLLPSTATTLTITGANFSPTAANDAVTFNNGAVGIVTSATTTSLTVGILTYPTTAGILTAAVTTSVGTGATVEVATVAPSVTFNNANTTLSTPTLTIFGTGFDANTANDTVTLNDGAAGSVTSATSTSLTVTLSSQPSAAGNLTAVVTTDSISSGSAIQVATVAYSVTANSANLSLSTPTLTIFGYGFDTATGNDIVTFNNGAVGTVSAASSTSLTVTFSTEPTALGTLTAVVTTDSVSSGAPTQVGTVALSVTSNTASIALSTSTLTIFGYGFDPATGNDIVTFNDGAVGTVSAASSTSLTVAFSTQPTVLGTMTAIVTTDSVSSGAAVQVATVALSVTQNTANLAPQATTVTINGFGFDPTPANNTVVFNEGAGTVASATSTSLIVNYTTQPTASGSLTAVVTTDSQSSGSPVQIGTVAVTVTQSTAYLAFMATTLTINGSGFDPNSANDSVSFSSGAVGTVASATASTLTIGFTTTPTALGSLTALVTVDTNFLSGPSTGTSPGTAVQVATVGPVVTSTTSNSVADSATTLTINGAGFSTTTSSDTVTLSSGATGTVASATASQLIVNITAPPTALGSLTALVTVGGASSGTAVQVATITNGTWVVTSNVGSGGTFSSISLPYLLGTSGKALSGDIITFASAMTISLTTALTITKSLTITGLGAANTIITGHASVGVIVITTASLTNTISSLTIENGKLASGGGAGIYNDAASSTLTLNNDTITGNTASAANGGGIYNIGTLTLNNDTISSNSSSIDGGGLYDLSTGSVKITNSTLSSNTATIGGGIYISGAITVTVSNSTLSSNSATSTGGAGFYAISGTKLTMIDDTISGNLASLATSFGGGLYLSGITATLENDTISGNSAHTAGGLYDTGSTVTLLNSIVAGDTATTDTDIDAATAITSASYDLIGVTSGFTATTSTHNQLGVTAGFASTLNNNGGPTSTLALLSTSAAVGTGESISGITTDQRGISLASPADIGAFDLETVTSNSTLLTGSPATITINGFAFDPTAANDSVTFNDGAAGTVTTATSTSLIVTFSAQPTANGSLTAIVTTDGVSSGPAIQVATVSVTPSVTTNTSSLAINASTITVTGLNFSATPSNDSVTFNLGAVGSVTSATTTSLVVALTTDPTTTGSLTAVVAVTGDGNSGSAVQVATVYVPTPTVTMSSANLPNNAATITINGSNFSTTSTNDTVSFNSGSVVGSVTSATASTLIVTFSTYPLPTGNLTAVVSVSGLGSSTNTEVASVTAPSILSSGGTLSANASTITISGFSFSSTPTNDSVSFNLGAVGTVTSASSGSLTVTFTTEPTATGGLDATVTVTGVGVSSSTQVGTVLPVVTSSATSLPVTASTLTINGFAFDTTAANDIVSFNDSVTGTVSSATNTTLTVTLTGLTSVTGGTALDANVTIDSVSSGSQVQVATVAPVLTSSTANLQSTVTSLTLTGYGFDTTAGNDIVSFDNSVTGTVASATSTSLTVNLTGLSGVSNDAALHATVTVDGASSSMVQVATVIASFGVSSVSATPSGVVLTFDEPIDPTTTVLYSSPGSTAVADVTVMGATTGPVRGSLVIDPTNPDVATFVQTSGLLAPDIYTVSVTSAVQAVGGMTLAGNYSSTVTVGTTSTPIVSVPSFSRGPGQSVALTDSLGNTTGIPVDINDATNATQAAFTLTYDPTLLTIAGSGALTLSTLATAAGIDTVNYSITSVDSNHSVLTATLTSSEAGSGLTMSTAETLVTIAASVPDSAPYLNKALLNLTSVSVNGTGAAGISGVDENAYVGNVSGNGSISALDASLVNQVGSGAGTGFTAFKDLDPAIIGGVSGDSNVSALDASLINQAGSGLTVSQIPLVPTDITLVTGGPDPYLFLSAVQGSAGQTVTETLYLDVTDPNGIQLSALDEAIGFDAKALQISDVRNASGLMANGSYSLASSVDNTSGVLLAGQAFAGEGLPSVLPYGTEIAVLQFNVTLNADATIGSETGLTLLQDGTINGQTKFTAISDNEGALTFTPGMVPSNGGNAAIDGSVTVVAPTATAASETETSHTSRPVVVLPKVIQPVHKVAPVTTVSSSAAAASTPEAAGTSVIVVVETIETPTAVVEIVVVNVGPLLQSTVVVQPEIVIVSTVTTSSPMPTSEMARSADPGAALTLAVQGSSKVAVSTPTATSAGKTTNVLDEMYRQMSGAPVGGFTLIAGGEETTEELDDVWELESILADGEQR